VGSHGSIMEPRSQALKNALWQRQDRVEGVEIEKPGNIAGLFAGSVNGYFWFCWPGLSPGLPCWRFSGARTTPAK
jgi:hypothetical protein